MVGSKSGVVVRDPAGSGGRGLDGGVGEFLVGEGQSGVDKGRQLVLVINEENLRGEWNALYKHIHTM